MKRIQRILLSCVLVIIIFLSFYNFSIQPKREQIRDLTEQHKKVAELLQTSRGYIDKYKSVKAAYDSISVVWAKLEELLPEQEEMPELLSSISDAGKKSGAEFVLFKPLSQVPCNFYSENPIQIKVTCNYHELGWFLSRVGGLTRLVNVSNFKLISIKNPLEATMDAEFVATAYVTTQKSK